MPTVVPQANHRHADECQPEDTGTKQSRYFDRHREPFDPNRKGLMLPLLGLLDSTAIYPGQKTRAPSPCWRDSTSKPVNTWRKGLSDRLGFDRIACAHGPAHRRLPGRDLSQ